MLAQAARLLVQCHSCADQRLEAGRVDRIVFADVDGALHVAVEADAAMSLCIDNVYTNDLIVTMRKISNPASDILDAADVSIVKADTKGSINLRIADATRQLIDDAATILGKTRTEFMVESARQQAMDVLLDQRLFVLDADRSNAFMHALDHPVAPGPKLRALLRRIPAWQK